MSTYEGWYSVKDESFYQEKELKKEGETYKTEDGSVVEWIKEESFFLNFLNGKITYWNFMIRTQNLSNQNQE